MSGEPLSILLVDQHPATLESLARFLKSNPHVQLIGAYDSEQTAMEAVRRLQPDVIVYDMPASADPHADYLLQWREALPSAGIVVTGVEWAEPWRVLALASGADEFVSTAALERELIPAIERAVGRRRAA